MGLEYCGAYGYGNSCRLQFNGKYTLAAKKKTLKMLCFFLFLEKNVLPAISFAAVQAAIHDIG